MSINDDKQGSFINQIKNEKDQSLNVPESSSKYLKVPKSIVIFSCVVFSVMLIAIISLSINQISTKKYSQVMDIEDLILIKDFNRAEELCYQNLYSENPLSGYSEGALLRIAGHYAASGDHKKSKIVLERILSSNPTSFVGRTSLVITSALSGDIPGSIKGIADIPNITAYIPGIHTIIKDFTVGNIINSKGIVEYILKLLLTK